ncbi:MAG: hypothetical protein SGARI_006705 [Bacillariaceae sp.]
MGNKPPSRPKHDRAQPRTNASSDSAPVLAPVADDTPPATAASRVATNASIQGLLGISPRKVGKKSTAFVATPSAPLLFANKDVSPTAAGPGDTYITPPPTVAVVTPNAPRPRDGRTKASAFQTPALLPRMDALFPDWGSPCHEEGEDQESPKTIKTEEDTKTVVKKDERSLINKDAGEKDAFKTVKETTVKEEGDCKMQAIKTEKGSVQSSPPASDEKETKDPIKKEKEFSEEEVEEDKKPAAV